MDGNSNSSNETNIVASIVGFVEAAHDQGWRIDSVRVSKITDEGIVDEDDTPWGQVEAMLDACDGVEGGSDHGCLDAGDVAKIASIAAIGTSVELMYSALRSLEDPSSGDDAFDLRMRVMAEVIRNSLDWVYELCDSTRTDILGEGGDE